MIETRTVAQTHPWTTEVSKDYVRFVLGLHHPGLTPKRVNSTFTANRECCYQRTLFAIIRCCFSYYHVVFFCI